MFHKKLTPMLLAAALLFVAGQVQAKNGVEDDGSTEIEVHKSSDHSTSTTATSSRKGVKDTEKIEKLLAQYREKMAKNQSKVEKKMRKASSTSSSMRGDSIANVDASCVQKAVDTREVALQNAFGKSDTAVMDALKARQTALYAAWGQTEVSARNTALKGAWKAWKDAQKAAGKTLKSERDSAWKTFKTTVKDTCKVSVPAEDASAGTDTAGQTAI